MMRRKSGLRPPEQRDTASQREECCGIRLLHPERQSLREQHADGEPVHQRHHGGGPARRQARHALGLDRRAPFQLAGRAVLPGSGARLYRRANKAHPARARGDGAAAASSDPRRRAMGHARSAQQRARGFRSRTRLRPAGVPALPRLVRGQSDDLRRRPGGRAQIVGGGRSHLLPRQALFLRRRAHHAQAGAAADPGLCRIVLQALNRIGGTAQLRPDRRPLRRRHELRRLATGGGPLSRQLRQVRQGAAAPNVQLFHPLRRHKGAGGRPARAPDPLLP